MSTTKLLYKICVYAIIGFIVLMIIWRIATYAAIGLIIFGFFYFGLKSFRNRFKRKK